MIDFIATAVFGILASMGVGGGGLLVVYLASFKNISQLCAQGINLLCFIPSSAISVVSRLYTFKKYGKLILVMCVCGTAASVVFSFVADSIGSSALKKGFGIMLILAGIYQFFSVKKSANSKDGKT